MRVDRIQSGEETTSSAGTSESSVWISSGSSGARSVDITISGA
jgi:hypothetical protein